MDGTAEEGKRIDFLPYLLCTNTHTRQEIKLLIDTGANKNIIRPGIIPRKVFVPAQTSIKNISGKHKIERKCAINLLGNGFPRQDFYELEFHNFFDGILGAETLARLEGKINFPNNTVTLNGTVFEFRKYFPKTTTYNHVISCNTLINGDWFVPEPQKLTDSIEIQPGLYGAKGGKTQIVISTKNPVPPETNFTLGLNVNNFETVTPEEDKKHLEFRNIRDLLRMDHLSKLEKEKIFELVSRHKKLLLKPGQKLTTIKGAVHKIHTRDEVPIYTKSYRYPHHFKKDVEEQVSEMLKDGIITNSNSPYNSPIWVVPKKLDASGKKKVRLVIDYRKLNDKTIEDKYPIPLIEDILDHLGQCEYFTTLDMKSGFHQIELAVEDRLKTAFSTESGHFEFTRMPFGLKNAPASFQRIMNNVLAGLIGKICLVYLDDIIVFGKSLEDHLEKLEIVFKRLSSCNLKIQLDKCEFLKREAEFLGHVVTPEGVRQNPDTTRKILDWPLPTSETKIRQFNGLASYYRRFVKDYAKIMRPIVRYTRKDTVLDTNDPEFHKAFETIKQVIASDQVLAFPNFELPFILTTDASDFALGAVLSQVQDGVERPIAFGSRSLEDHETRYATNEKEALAIIWAVNKYKPYLYGNKFTLVTDHKPLTFIKSSDKNAKILRWRLELENYDYDVVYREGKTNVVADALSRRQDDVPARNDPPDKTQEINFLSQETDSQTAHSADTSDDYFLHISDRPINYYRNQIIFKISHIETEASETPFPGYSRVTILRKSFTKNEMTNHLLRYHNGKQTAILAPIEIHQIIQEAYRENFSQNGHFVLTSSIVEDVTIPERQDALVSNEHERAHRGISEVEAQLRRSYFFPGLSQRITRYINSCSICAKHKYDRKPYNIKISTRPITERPFQRIHMDIFIMNNDNFLSFIDSFSKHLQMIPIKTKNLVDVTRAVTKYIHQFRAPELIITDHETTFRSADFRSLLDAYGTRLEYASSSESNGQIEKTHATIIEIYNTNKHKFQSLNTKGVIRASVCRFQDISSTYFGP